MIFPMEIGSGTLDRRRQGGYGIGKTRSARTEEARNDGR
jgi:hypothetical protein